jgi:hypothetical protein
MTSGLVRFQQSGEVAFENLRKRTAKKPPFRDLLLLPETARPRQARGAGIV